MIDYEYIQELDKIERTRFEDENNWEGEGKYYGYSAEPNEHRISW